MTDIRPRFEFRVWGEGLDDTAARLRALAASAEEAVTEETYLVALDRDDVNPKIRGGVLDIKVLAAEIDRCEQWQPWIKEEFPLANSLLAEEILPRLGAVAMTLDRDSYGFTAFIDEVVHPHPQLRAATVAKRRLKYTLAGCLAEEAEVTVDGFQLHTVAAESADLDALTALRHKLGIEQFENVSYPRALKRVLGWDRR